MSRVAEGSIAYIGPVAKGSVEWLSLGVEQVPDVSQTGHLKHLWLLLNHLSAQIRRQFMVKGISVYVLWQT